MASDIATAPATAGGKWTGKALTLNKGISQVESNDASYIAAVAGGTTTTLLDTYNAGPGANIIGPDGVNLTGAVYANTGDTVTLQTLSAATATPTQAATTIAFGGVDTTAIASGSTPAVDAAFQVDTITVTFAPGKEVALNATAPAKTAADLAANLVVTVNGITATNGATATANDPVQFQVRPVSAALSADGKTMTVVLPTAYIYSKIHATTKMEIEYLAAGVTGVAATSLLVGKADPTVLVSQAAIDASTTVGTERVSLPLSATPLTSALTTMDLKGTVTGAVAGDSVTAYLAKWKDGNTTSKTASIVSGKITNPGDKVATDLAIEFVDMGTLKGLIETQLNAVAAAAAAVPGVSNASTAVAAANIPVYVKLIRSNDAAATGNATNSQSYLNARAVLATNNMVAVNSFSDSGWNSDYLDPVYEVMLNPNTGAITGRLTGSIGIKVGTSTATGADARGLRYLDVNGQFSGTKQAGGVWSAGVVNAAGGFETMIGANAKSGNLDGSFVVLHHKSKVSGAVTALTSVDSGAANFVPFSADISRAGTRAVLPAFNLANIRAVTPVNSANWQLVGAGNPARAAGVAGNITPQSLPRMFEATVGDMSLWTERTAANNGKDMALALVGNKTTVATELSNGSTLSTITGASFVPGSAAIAFANADNTETGTLFVMQQAAPAAGVKLPVGWSLVTVPGVPGATVTALGAGVEAVIRVGAGASQFTWLKADGAMPALKAGEAVFVYSKTANSAL
jgi:hypothetical protein